MSDDGAPLGGDVPANETPRAPRDALFLGAVIERQAGSATGRIRNISPTGALLETSESLQTGETIIISFRGVEQSAAIVTRRTAKGYGIQFAANIDPSACRLPTSQTAQPNEFVLNLREGYRRSIWDNNGEVFKRPGTK